MTNSKGIIEIKFDETDALGFKGIVNSIITNLIDSLNPDEISIIRIKNWFDHKWLNYSGKKIIKYDTQSNPEIPFVLEPFWNKKITIPPFNPNRVLSESFFRLKGIENKEFEELFHKYQNSTENRNNLISKKTMNGLCVWVSSNSKINDQGSLMVYQIKKLETLAWYISIENNRNNWEVTQTKGISKNQILAQLK
ncbi:hypothetical protein JYT89_03500 [Flavobacteriaceae bacterium AH-315-B10]|nr:hypothetical protein [Flavobacteriaceae bacterium AH-315-B10]